MLFWRTSDWRKYVMAATWWDDSEDLSFDIMGNSDIRAMLSLIREGDSLTFQGGACPEPCIFDKNNKKYIVDAINNVAVKHNIKRIHIKTDLPEYLNYTGYTCILDPVFTYMPRKGHKSAIAKGKKVLTVTKTTDVHTFMNDYFEMAGRVTRPEKSFEILQEFCNKGWFILFKAMYGNETAGYTMIVFHKLESYYFMSGSFEKFRECNVGHVLQDYIIEFLAKRGIRKYELGEQVYNSLFLCYDEKERNISSFKRGFGGKIVPYSHSEYFWDKSQMEVTLQSRMNKYIDTHK